ncbi:tail fiber protein [Aquibium sp. LZ166]|uniref:Tail fiber protein n=1 Tax=Aquibium pacificus TaxID=3153579 RepID=A0ABV3SRC8_9HYPH
MKTQSRYIRAVAVAAILSGPAFTSSPANAQAEPFIGQLMLFGGNFCPRGWGRADGSLLAISQNTALFSILGTTYGGNGQTTFALPDLRGRAPIHNGTGPGLTNYILGQTGGAESLTIGINNMPPHNHSVRATSSDANKKGPANDFLGANDTSPQYHDGPADKVMDPAMIANTGGGQAIGKRSPYLALMWCVALVGIYPSQN